MELRKLTLALTGCLLATKATAEIGHFTTGVYYYGHTLLNIGMITSPSSLVFFPPFSKSRSHPRQLPGQRAY